MSSERVYSVNGAVALPAKPITLAEAGLKERDDLQEWVIAHPEILGDGVKVITFEFDRWWDSSGTRQLDRFDVLGIDPDGHLVVAELKRDKAPDTVEMQAIKYAALVSRFTADELVEAHARFLSRGTGEIDLDAATTAIQDHLGGDLDEDVFATPRIVLVAGSFPPVLTSTVHWLSQVGVRITLQTVQAYRLADEQIVVSVSQLYPLPDVEDLLVRPGKGATTGKSKTSTTKREGSTVVRLVRERAIEDGTEVRLVLPDDLDASLATAAAAWLAEDPLRGRATWRNNRKAPLVWAADGASYRPLALTRKVFAAVGSPLSGKGPAWWSLPDGRSLTEVAAELPGGGFDRDLVHSVLAGIPKGRWTTYGDLADAVGTGAQALSQHIAKCPDCPNFIRVVGKGGAPSDGFKWSDPNDVRTQRQALEAEGVAFPDGVADPAARMTVNELDLLADNG